VKPLTILHTESSKGWGGQEMRILQDSQLLTRLGFPVVILCQPDSELFERANQKGIKVETISMTKMNLIKGFKKCQQVIEDEKIDIVNTHSSRDSWIASLSGRFSKYKPIICRTRHLSIPIQSNWISWVLFKYLADGIITTGEIIRKNLIDEHGIPENRILSIPTGIDPSVYDPEKFPEMNKEIYGITPDSFLVGMVSVIRSWKGHLDLVVAAQDVVKKFPSVSFLIVGDGPAAFQIKAKVKELELQDRFHFLGFREDVPRILSCLDLFVHPSYANEGVPQAVLQALAMKKAVVACGVGGISEVIQDGLNGKLVPPRDPTRLAEAIIRLVEDQQTRKSMGERGRIDIQKNWSFEEMIEKTLAFYKELLRKRDLQKKRN
jgi:glycosyltransferase involved in cell wall biosynthesis